MDAIQQGYFELARTAADKTDAEIQAALTELERRLDGEAWVEQSTGRRLQVAARFEVRLRYMPRPDLAVSNHRVEPGLFTNRFLRRIEVWVRRPARATEG